MAAKQFFQELINLSVVSGWPFRKMRLGLDQPIFHVFLAHSTRWSCFKEIAFSANFSSQEFSNSPRDYSIFASIV